MLSTRPSDRTRGVPLRLAVVFALLTFVQGIAEPTEGLVSQPVRSRIAALGHNAARVTTFAAVISLPWALKPVFGMAVDFVPGARARRRIILAVAGAIWAAVFGVLGLNDGAATSPGALLLWLLAATSAAALADVTTDALVVEWGQVHRLTGRYQAAVWMAAYASGIASGMTGGAISATGQPRIGYLICGGCGLALFALALAAVNEPPQRTVPPSWAEIRRSLAGAIRSPSVRWVLLFLVLSNLNPLTNPVLHLHMTGALQLTERFFGNSLSVFSVAAMVAAAVYAAYCTRIPVPVLAYSSVGLGVVANIAYLRMSGPRSAMAATAVVGFCYMTATLVQFDLAARACPPGAIATVFASFMAVSNLSTAVSTSLGGFAYERIGSVWGDEAAFRVLIVAGAGVIALAALVIPWFPPALLKPVPADSTE